MQARTAIASVALIFLVSAVSVVVAVESGWISLPFLPPTPILPPTPVLIPVIAQDALGRSLSGILVSAHSDVDGVQSLTTNGNDPTVAPKLSLRPTVSYSLTASITWSGLIANRTVTIMMPSGLNTRYEIYAELYFSIYPAAPHVEITRLELLTW